MVAGVDVCVEGGVPIGPGDGLGDVVKGGRGVIWLEHHPTKIKSRTDRQPIAGIVGPRFF